MNAAPAADRPPPAGRAARPRGTLASRSRARDAIERGAVRVDGEVAAQARPERFRRRSDRDRRPGRRYVSRAALKLIAGLDHFGFDPAGSLALDIGASTGGFTQVLLERGAAHVTAIDVGHGQMRSALAADPRVTSIEGLERARPDRGRSRQGRRRISSSATSASSR